MKILVAPDSFKGCLSSEEVCKHIEFGIKKANKNIEIVTSPIADGGEGTVSAFIEATKGRIIEAKAHDPLMRQINTYFGVLGDEKTVIIEMCATSGLTLLTEAERDPMITSTYGTGELIKAALDLGFRNIIIGVGGSATNDGGMGMAQALGVKFYDEAKQELPQGGGALSKLRTIDPSELDSRISQSRIIVACDVENTLYGPNGAAVVFAPQKGANLEVVKILDDNLKNYAKIVKEVCGIDLQTIKGSGAAGGLAGGLLAFLNASLSKGIDIVSDAVKLEEKIKAVDYVITGEGKMDSQTSFGKAPLGVASMAKRYNIPVIGICGAMVDNMDPLYSQGFTSIFSIADRPMTLSEAIHRAPYLLENLSTSIANLLTSRETVN